MTDPCWECGEPLRDCDDGATCFECVEDIDQYGEEYYDTRPEDRRAQVRERWHKLRADASWLCAAQFRALGTPRAEDLRLRLLFIVEEQSRAWAWFLRWSLAVMR